MLFLTMSCVVAEGNDTSLEDANIDAPDVSMYYHNGTRFAVSLSDSNNNSIANESIVININAVNYTRITDGDGKASIAINLIPGKYLVNVYFLGNDVYLKNNKTSSVEVLSTIYANDLTKYYKNASQYYATFVDDFGNPLVNENVTFNINGVFYTRQTNGSGVSRLNINLNPGEYILTAYNSKGHGFSNKITVISTVNASDLYKIYRDNNQYWATFRNMDGGLLTNTDVNFNINGVLYTRKSNEYGNARLNINLNQGDYILTAVNPVNNECYSNWIHIYEYSETSLLSSNHIFKSNEDDTIIVKLLNNLNYGVSDKNISLTVAGQKFISTTDNNGVAYFDLGLPQGNYSLSFNYPGNANYGSSSIKTQIEVYDGISSYLSGPDNLVLSNGDLVNVTLLDSNKKPLVNESIYFSIDSNMYSSKTNEKGIATININITSGNYNVVYFFNKTGYKFQKGVFNAVIIANNQTILNPLTSSVTEGMKDKFQVKLSVDGAILANREVIISINNRNYTKITDSEGVASITINLNGGTYTVTCYYLGDDKLKPSSISVPLVINKRISTNLVPTVANSMHKNSGIPYKVLLTSENGVLADKRVILTINSQTLSSTTDANGIAQFDIDNLNEGSYSIHGIFEGDRSYSNAEFSNTFKITSQIDYGYSYWVRYLDMNNLNLASLSSQGTKHIFLHSYAFTAYGTSSVLSWINTARSYGINVHIWMQICYDGNWIRPINDDGSFKYSFIAGKVNEARYYASLSGVAGVHLDYLRFGGTAHYYSNSAEVINYIVTQIYSAVKSVNPNCILSAAIMPEPNMLIYYYGQDIPTISKYLDVIVPMIYKGNYGKNTAWIQQTTKEFVEMSNGAQVWSGLQTYRSDEDITRLSYNELFGDAQASLNGGARGVTMFRWGITNYIDFNKLKMS